VFKKATGYTYDLGGLGKGYALDCALGELLCDWEIEAGHISAGGSTGLCWGTGLERNTAWSFDLETGPKPTSAKYKLVLYNKYAVSGSGTWQKGAHIINPQTGRPVRTDRLAWAIHPNAIYADAFSTAAMLLPLSHLQFISEQVTNLAFIIIDPAEQESPILLGDTSMFHFQENQ
jgi:thiamine biosynthesis lipoprotein